MRKHTLHRRLEDIRQMNEERLLYGPDDYEYIANMYPGDYEQFVIDLEQSAHRLDQAYRWGSDKFGLGRIERKLFDDADKAIEAIFDYYRIGE